MSTSIERQLKILELRAKGCSINETAKQVGIGRHVLLKDLQAFARDNGFKEAHPPQLIDFAIGKGWIEGPIGHSEGTLSEREREIAALVAEGLSNFAIGRRLYISVNTVKTRLKSIYKKTGAKNRRQLAAIARQRGLVE